MLSSCQNIFNILTAGRQNWLFWGLLWVGSCGGQTPNVPMWAGIKLFFKMCGGKIFKTFWVGLSVGKVRSVSSLQRTVSCSKSAQFFVAVCVKLPTSLSTKNGLPTVGHNVLGLGEVGELEVQMFNLAQMLIRITNVQISTSAPILPNPC